MLILLIRYDFRDYYCCWLNKEVSVRLGFVRGSFVMSIQLLYLLLDKNVLKSSFILMINYKDYQTYLD